MEMGWSPSSHALYPFHGASNWVTQRVLAGLSIRNALYLRNGRPGVCRGLVVSRHNLARPAPFPLPWVSAETARKGCLYGGVDCRSTHDTQNNSLGSSFFPLCWQIPFGVVCSRCFVAQAIHAGSGQDSFYQMNLPMSYLHMSYHS